MKGAMCWALRVQFKPTHMGVAWRMEAWKASPVCQDKIRPGTIHLATQEQKDDKIGFHVAPQHVSINLATQKQKDDRVNFRVWEESEASRARKTRELALRAAAYVEGRPDNRSASELAAVEERGLERIAIFLNTLEEGDRAYVNQGLANRMSVNLSTDPGFPKFGDEIFVWFMRTNTTILKTNGERVMTADIKQLLFEKRLEYDFVDADPNPAVIAKVEKRATQSALDKHYDETLNDMAGTRAMNYSIPFECFAGGVDVSKIVPVDGFTAGAWILRGATSDPNLVVATIEESKVTQSEARKAIEERVRKLSLQKLCAEAGSAKEDTADLVFDGVVVTGPGNQCFFSCDVSGGS